MRPLITTEELNRQSRHLLGTIIHATSYADTCEQVTHWVREGKSAYVCLSNVHMVMEAYDDPAFQKIVNEADLVTPDGAPITWALRLLGAREATQVRGPDLTPELCRRSARERIPVGFYGGTPEVLDQMISNLKENITGLEVAYRFSPPFSPLDRSEQDRVFEDINASGARILFVGLGCPKQEKWMAENKNHTQAVMLGVGAAFDILADRNKEAPHWMQVAGLEWAYRLANEPRRLWRRYLYNNPRFLGLFLMQLLGRGSSI